MSKTSLLSPRLSRTDRVWLMAQVMPTAVCDVWLGAVGRDGYGRFSLTRPGGGERIITPYLAAATIAFGPIPLGATLMHDCDVRVCVSIGPGHLRVATQRENVRQAVRRGRSAGPKPGLVDVRGPAGASRAVQGALRAVAADRLSAAELAVVLAEVLAVGDPLRAMWPMFDTLPGGQHLGPLDRIGFGQPADDLFDYASRIPPAPIPPIQSLPLFDLD